MSKFTDKQRSVIARKLGYDGPMQGFDDFLRSSPELAAKYSSVTDEYVKRFNSGGLVKQRKYAAGGMVEPNVGIAQDIPPPGDDGMMYANNQPIKDATIEMGFPPGYYGSRENIEAPYNPVIRNDIDQSVDGSTVNKGAVTATPTNNNLDSARYGSFTDIGGKPIVGAAPVVSAEQIATSAGQFLSTAGIPALTAAQVAPFTPATTAQAGAPNGAPAATMTSAQGTPALQQQLTGVNAAQGGVGQNAMVNAQQGQLSKGAFAGAATGSATMATAANRTQQAGEMIDGSSVNQAKIDDVLNQNKAEQGVVTDEMTTQGQLNKMMAQFDAGNPPPWAAGAMRAANAQMAARGIGASSIAGAAIVQIDKLPFFKITI
jgi:hypothetical protein